MLLASDHLIFLQVLSYLIAVLFKELIVFFLQDTSLLCVHGLFR